MEAAIGPRPMADALAQLDFIKRAEVVHFLGPPSPLSLEPMAQQ